MKSKFLYIIFFFASLTVAAQQLPFYTQYKSNNFLINPAVTGTSRFFDARLNYRTQWAGYDGAPKTTSLAMHTRLVKGKMGAGVYLSQDKIGPFKQTNIGATYAFHIRFPDCELSAGLGGNFTKSTLIGNKITLHDNQDAAIDQFTTNSTWVADASGGIYLYNDRFHIGLSALQTLQSSTEYYKSDSLKKGIVKHVTHSYFTIGYNYAENPDYIWENTIYANYVTGIPFSLNYTLRLHIKNKFITGISVRMRDAIAFHVGATINDSFQVCYSYDYLLGKFRNYSGGSHEITLIFCSDLFMKKINGKVNKQFLKQRYRIIPN